MQSPGNEFIVVTMATLSYGTAYCNEKYSVKAELAVLTVL
jgi:hypothetical protein